MPNTIQHSDEIQDILSKPPSWMLRWGLTGLAAFILLALAGSFFISYPNIISGNLVLTTETPPFVLKAYSDGRIDSVLVNDGDIVSQGTVIAIIDSPEEYGDIVELDCIVDSIMFYSNDSVVNSSQLAPFAFCDLQLGEMQNTYTQLSTAIADQISYDQSYDFENQKGVIQEKKQLLGNLITINGQQYDLLEERIELSRHKHSTDSLLYSQKVISAMEFEKSRSELLNDNNQYSVTVGSFLNNKMQYTLTKEQENTLVTTHNLRVTNFHSLLVRMCYELDAMLASWKQRYIIASPTDGRVSLFDLKPNEPATVGQDLAMVTPTQAGEIIGEIFLPMKGASMVKVEQHVKVKLSGYPYQQFGLVTGTVESISALPKDSAYHVIVNFPNGLVTSTNNTLEFQPLMTGSAEIITEKRSLLDRFFGRLTSIFE